MIKLPIGDSELSIGFFQNHQLAIKLPIGDFEKHQSPILNHQLIILSPMDDLHLKFSNRHDTVTVFRWLFLPTNSAWKLKTQERFYICRQDMELSMTQ